MPSEFLLLSLPSQNRTLAYTAYTEFMPTCAILGGVMGQDALNTLGGREPPVINLFTLDGTSGMGDFNQLGFSS